MPQWGPFVPAGLVLLSRPSVQWDPQVLALLGDPAARGQLELLADLLRR